MEPLEDAAGSVDEMGVRLPEEQADRGEVTEETLEETRSLMADQAEYIDNLGDAKRDVELEDPDSVPLYDVEDRNESED